MAKRSQTRIGVRPASESAESDSARYHRDQARIDRVRPALISTHESPKALRHSHGAYPKLRTRPRRTPPAARICSSCAAPARVTICQTPAKHTQYLSISGRARSIAQRAAAQCIPSWSPENVHSTSRRRARRTAQVTVCWNGVLEGVHASEIAQQYPHEQAAIISAAGHLGRDFGACFGRCTKSPSRGASTQCHRAADASSVTHRQTVGLLLVGEPADNLLKASNEGAR